MKLLSPASFHSDQESELYNRIAWRLLPYLVLLLIVSFVDRINIGFAKLQMASDIGLTDLAYGTGAGLFFVGYCLFEIPSNLILQRIGARLWLGVIMLVWGAISAAMAFVTNVHEFYALRVLLGVAEAGCYPGVMLYMTYWFPARLRSQVCAIFFLGLTFGGMLGGPLSGWILQTMTHIDGLRGWQWLFIVEAAPAILLGLFTVFRLPNGPLDAKWLPAETRGWVHRTASAGAGVKRGTAHSERAMSALCSPTIWLIALANFAVLGGAYGVSFWLPQIIRGTGVADLTQIGLYAAIPYVFSGTSMVLVARRSDRLQERRWHSIVPMFLSIAGFYVAGAGDGSLFFWLAGLTLAIVGAQTVSGVLWSVPAAQFSNAAAGTALAMVTIGGNIGGYVVPVMIGYLKTQTGRIEFGFYALCAIQIVGVIALLLIPATRFKMGPDREDLASGAACDAGTGSESVNQSAPSKHVA